MMRLHITPKLILVFVIFAAVLLASVSVLAYSSGRASLESATVSDLLSTATEKEAALNEWIAERKSDIRNVTNSSTTLENWTILLNDSLHSPTVLSARKRLLTELQSRTGQELALLDLSIIEPKNGKVILSTDMGEEGKYREDRLEFIHGKSGLYVQSPYYSLQLLGPTMTVSGPLHSADGQLLGVLVGRLNLDKMAAIISRRTGLRETDDTFLVNTSNLFVTQPRLTSDRAVLQRGIHTEPVKRCVTRNSGVMLTDDYRDVPVIVVYRWLPERELCLIVKMDQTEAFQPVHAFAVTLATISGLALLLASLLAVALARTLTRPILMLQAGVMRFGQGELGLRLPEQSGDELGALAREFNRMATTLSEKESQLHNHATQLEEKVQERTAELRDSETALIEALDRERTARTQAEVAQNRIALLLEASSFLAESPDYQTRLRQFAHFVVPRLADWCAIYVIERDGSISRVVVAHKDPAKVAWAEELQRRYPPDPNSPRGVYQVIRSGQAEFYPNITEEMLTAAGLDAEQLRLVREIGFTSAMTIPLVANERILGAISLVTTESGHHFDPDDLSLANDLARRAAMLIENAQLYHEAQSLSAELEARVIERTAQLETANKELEAFSYSVSHDLRAPLRAVDGYSRILLRDYAPQLPTEAQRRLEVVRTNAVQMGKLIDDLLTFSRLQRQTINKQMVALAPLAQRVFEELSSEQENRQIQFVISDLPPCEGDPALLKQVFVNLLSNALKFTRQREKAYIEVGCYNQHEKLPTYFVKDDGTGFDMKYADKLFGVFQRLHRMEEYEGTGVGLAIVQRIIHRHGGHVWAEAEVDKGATFYFTLEGGTSDG